MTIPAIRHKLSQKDLGGESVAQITLRGMAPEIEQKIRRISRETGKSLNLVILEMIYNYTGFNKKEQISAAASLRRLAGGWSDKDALQFFESIKPCQQIDESMWR